MGGSVGCFCLVVFFILYFWLMNFCIGQCVGYLYEMGYVIVKVISGNCIIVEDENGFDNMFNVLDLVVIYLEVYDVKKISIEDVKFLEEVYYWVVDQLMKMGQCRKDVVWEVDLYIEEIFDLYVGFFNMEILLK